MTGMEPAEGLTRAAHDLVVRARREIEQTGRLRLVYEVQRPDGNAVYSPLPDELNEDFNRGSERAEMYRIFRRLIREEGCVGFMAAGDAFVAEPAAKGPAAPEESTRVSKELGIKEARKRGLVDKTECIVIRAQTSQTVTFMSPAFERHLGLNITTFGELKVTAYLQSTFKGPVKVFDLEDVVGLEAD